MIGQRFPPSHAHCRGTKGPLQSHSYPHIRSLTLKTVIKFKTYLHYKINEYVFRVLLIHIVEIITKRKSS